MAKDDLSLQTEYKALAWEPYVHTAAFWVLFVLCVSPLLSTAVLFFGAATDNPFVYSLLDAYFFHLKFNYALGLAALLVLVAWLINRFCLFGLSTFSELLEQKWTIPLLLLILWVAISTFLNCSGLWPAIIGDESRFEGVLSLLCYAGFALCALLVDEEERRRAILLAFCAISAIIGLLYIAQTAGVGILADLTDYGFCVTFGNLNHHGYYVALGVLAAAGLFAYEEHMAMKVAAAVTVVLLSVCLIINGSFGPFLAAAFALVFLSIIALVNGGKGKLIALVPLALFLCVALGNTAGADYKGFLSSLGQDPAPVEITVASEGQAADQAQDGTAQTSGGGAAAGGEASEGASSDGTTASTTESNFSSLIQDIKTILSGSGDIGSVGSFRGALYIASAQLIAENPVMGYGMEEGGPLLDERAGVEIDRAHNEILQWGIYGGVPAMLLYVAGMVMLAVRQLRRLRQLDAAAVTSIGCVAAYLCSSLFGCVMISVTPYFWMFIGLAAWLPVVFEREVTNEDEVQDSE